MSLNVKEQQNRTIVVKQRPQPKQTKIVIKLVDDNNKVKNTTTFTCVDANVGYIDQSGKKTAHNWITGGIKNIVCRTMDEFNKWISSFEQLAGKNDRTIDNKDQERFDKMQLEQKSSDSVQIGNFEIVL